jgi:pilus assembly protein FimV
VCDNTLKQWVLAALFLLMPWVADAAGLGRLVVLSSLGQPLHAEIDLVSVRNDELSTLSVRLASPDMYKQANLQYGSGLIGLRLSIEKRPGGQPYIKVVTLRPIQEPFIDLLLDLHWASGRITREYTALLDPPGFGSAVAELAPPSTPMAARPAPAPAATAAPSARVAPVADSAAAGAKEYGPIKPGETLGKIATSLKPEGVSLEQMLVGLYRNNPDAFINKNLNLVKSGKILRVPEREALSSVPQQAALKEYRAQVADWNAYRQRLADAASTAPESRAAISGKITPRVEDKAAGTEAKDVVRLSKGEPPGGAAGKGRTAVVERVRALEEEIVARGKAIKEAGERIAQLEKTISDQQRLLELKNPGMAAAQQQAKSASKPEEAPKPAAAASTDAKKDEPSAVAAAEKAAIGAKSEQPMVAPVQKPQPKAKPKAPPPPPPEPDLIETLLGEPLYLALGGGAILLAGLGLWMNRRRRSAPAAGGGDSEKPDPTLGKAHAAPAAAVAVPVAAASASYEVDPLAEAEVYIAYGRDGQAEEILKEALDKNPDNEKAQLKLLEIYAARKDKVAFNKLSAGFNKLTGGQGESWQKVVAMGYALDPENPFYAAGKDIPVADDLDFDLGEASTTTDILLDADAAQQATGETTEMMDPGAMQAMANAADHGSETPTAAPPSDIALEVPAAGEVSETDIRLDADKSADDNTIDFNIELPGVDEPVVSASEAVAKNEEEVMDFKLDFPDISLDIDDKAQTGTPVGGDKDAHWHDVQTKFDLAKAYQEMGENNDAKAILQEVLKEGDAQQQSEAKELLNKLG